MKKSFADQYRLKKTVGFDYLRIVLSVSVIIWHSFITSYGEDATDSIGYSPIWSFVGFILPSFFALSGFLVAGSVDRTRTLEGFATLRAIRLVPALAVEIILSALFLGPLLTTLPLTRYFSDPLFFSYFYNVIGIVQLHLPGLFISNPDAGVVNKSLWTVPYELHCYLWLIAFVAFGIFKRRAMFLGVTIFLMLLLPVSHYMSGSLFRSINIVPHRVLELSFLAGVCMYLYRDVIPHSKLLLFICVAASLVTLAHPFTQYLCVFPVTYVTVWIGLTAPHKVQFLKTGDYSYGMYLFAFPIQQVIAQYEWAQEWWISSALTIPICLLYAMFSWHYVENPVLSHKNKIVALVEALFQPIRNAINLAFALSKTNTR